MWNQAEWHTPELQLRYGEWTGAEELGVMCCQYFTLGGDRALLFWMSVDVFSVKSRRRCDSIPLTKPSEFE